jgi:DNA-binding CsgD family transcriptional regulator
MINKEKIIALKAEGKTQNQIAQDLGCTEGYVWQVLRDAGLTSTKMSMPPIERLQRRLKERTDTGCWEFQGAKTNFGYGQIKISGVNYRSHVLSYSLFVGEIPEGLFVCHRCDNPPCCNPDHLFLGTPKENHADMTAKNRQAKGATLPHTKVTSELKVRIQELKSEGLTNREIGSLLGVSHATISRNLNA